MSIRDEEEYKSYSKWMTYRDYDNFNYICADFCQILDSIHDYSEVRADGQRSALMFSTMHKIRMFRSWMDTKMNDVLFDLYAVDLLGLTREQFNDFTQANMIRRMGKTCSLPSGSSTTMASLSGYTKGPFTSESQASLNIFKKDTNRDVS